MPAYTWVSTAAAVVAVGAVPVIAEVDETLTIDVEDAASLVNARTNAIIPVHMRGAAADMAAVMELARRHDLVVIEDAAQAMGGSYGGRRLGTIGDLGCFSLQYNKIITCGEGGVVTTERRPDLHARALMYHDVAASLRAEVTGTPGFYGITCRMSELQGAVADVQLGRLDDIIADCRANRARIVDAIASEAERSQASACAPPRRGRRHRHRPDPAVPRAQAGGRARSARSRGTASMPRSSTIPRWRTCTWPPTGGTSSRHGRGRLAGRGQSRPASSAYGPERWSRTVEHLSSAVHIDISPDLTPDRSSWSELRFGTPSRRCERGAQQLASAGPSDQGVPDSSPAKAKMEASWPRRSRSERAGRFDERMASGAISLESLECVGLCGIRYAVTIDDEPVVGWDKVLRAWTICCADRLRRPRGGTCPRLRWPDRVGGQGATLQRDAMRDAWSRSRDRAR